jgi:hypothetical protein
MLESKIIGDSRGYSADRGDTPCSVILGYLTPWGPQISLHNPRSIIVNCLSCLSVYYPFHLTFSFLLRPTMSGPSKTETMHTERVEEAESQEAHPKVALSTILAVFVSLWKGLEV